MMRRRTAEITKMSYKSVWTKQNDGLNTQGRCTRSIRRGFTTHLSELDQEKYRGEINKYYLIGRNSYIYEQKTYIFFPSVVEFS